MPPRLEHKKSRTGCQRCKTRKVKCDEARPACRDCRRHQVECVYAAPSPTESVPKVKRPSRVLKEYDTNSLQPDDRRILELQLLHHFVTVASQTIPSSDDGNTTSVYRMHSIKLAFEHPVLLSSILALSALHMISSPRIEEPAHIFGQAARSLDDTNHPLHAAFDQKQLSGPVDAKTAHRIYLNLAIKQQQEAIEHIQRNQNATNALIIATVLLSYQALGFWNLETRSDEEEEVYHGPPTHWLRMVKGIESMADALSDSGNSPFLNFMASKAGKPDFTDRATLFHPDNAIPFMNLLDFETYPEGEMDSETENVYRLTVAYIGGIHRGIEDKEGPNNLFRRILFMGLMIPRPFLDYIDQKRPRALAILALYCCTLSVFEDHWMFHGMSGREIRGIEPMLPDEWKWSMQLPKRILEEGKYRSLFANSN